MTILHRQAIPSVVDQWYGRPYFAAMLAAHCALTAACSPKETARRPMSEAQQRQHRALSEAHKKRQIEVGERIFEQHRWACDTRQFAAAAKTTRAQAALNRLLVLGCVRLVKPAKGSRPAKWKWVRKAA